MSRRTLAEARILLERSLPHLNDYWAGQYKDVMEQQEARAKEKADETVAGRADEANDLRDAALRELTDVRDGLDDLTKEGKEGRLSSQQYLSRMTDLRSRQAAAEEALDRADAIAETVERIEGDPVAWFSELQERTPRLKVEVPW